MEFRFIRSGGGGLRIGLESGVGVLPKLYYLIVNREWFIVSCLRADQC